MTVKDYQNNWQAQQRVLDTPYAQRVREAKRSKKVLSGRREKRGTEEEREKAKLYAREYRKRPEARMKERARYAARSALVSGKIKRPDNCELCNMPDKPLKDGRSGLRMDHYLGYSEENWLNVPIRAGEKDFEK